MVTKQGNEMETFKTWEEMSVLEKMACEFWDMYKDAHGVRPRHVNTSAWTEQIFMEEFAYLGRVIEDNERRRESEESQASVDFEDRVKKLMDIGAKDRDMAMRWIHEAEGSHGDDEFLCYLVGLPYGYFRKVA